MWTGGTIDSGNPAQVVSALSTNPGFATLPATTQSKLQQIARGNDEAVSIPGRRALTQLLNDTNFTRSSPDQQAAQLSAFMTNSKWLPQLVAQSSHPATSLLPVSISGPVGENVKFDSGNAVANRYDVNVNGKVIPVRIAPTQAAGTYQPTIQQVANGLARLPPASLAALKEVLVGPLPNPSDSYWAKQYGDPNFRSYMTAGSAGTINIYPTTSPQTQSVLDGSLMHETGHTLSKRTFGENANGSGWANWRNAAAKDAVVPSQYAKNSFDEDFAETLQLYTLVKGTNQEASTRALFSNRFAMLDQMMGAR